MESFTASTHATIKAPPSKVWKALIDPEMIRQYLYGTIATSDWKVGSSITYTGAWNGRAYEDKGKVIRKTENKLLQTTYWSSLSKKPDTPENYNIVTYRLEEENGYTKITITQDNNLTKESALHSEENWQAVLGSMKAIRENETEE